MTVYYVDNINGNDSNDGTTTGAAWATIQKAINTVTPGDECYILEGDYEISTTLSVTTTTGSPGSYKKFIGVGQVRIVPASGFTGRAMYINGANYYHFENLEFSNWNRLVTTYYDSAPVYMYNGDYNKFVRCRWLNNRVYSSGTLNQHYHAAAFNCNYKNKYNQWIECTFANNENAIVNNSGYYGAGAFYAYNELQYSDFIKCLFYNNSTLDSHTYSGGAYGANNEDYYNTFEDCIFVSNKTPNRGANVAVGSQRNTLFTTSNAYAFYGNCIAPDNLVAFGGSNYPIPDIYNAGNFGADPEFIDAENGVFLLEKTSPCISSNSKNIFRGPVIGLHSGNCGPNYIGGSIRDFSTWTLTNVSEVTNYPYVGDHLELDGGQSLGTAESPVIDLGVQYPSYSGNHRLSRIILDKVQDWTGGSGSLAVIDSNNTDVYRTIEVKVGDTDPISNSYIEVKDQDYDSFKTFTGCRYIQFKITFRNNGV